MNSAGIIDSSFNGEAFRDYVRLLESVDESISNQSIIDLIAWCASHDINQHFISLSDKNRDKISFYGTPLYIACCMNNPRAVQIMLDSGANPNNIMKSNELNNCYICDTSNDSSYLHCCQHGYHECLIHLLNHQDLNYFQTKRDNRTVLGQSVMIYSPGGETALHLAVKGMNAFILI
jgi:hypothetical protein